MPHVPQGFGKRVADKQRPAPKPVKKAAKKAASSEDSD